MKRVLLLAAALLLLPLPALATPSITISLDSAFHPCQGEGTGADVLHATAFVGGVTAQYRVKWHVDGPLNLGDGQALSVTTGPAQVGPDMQDTYTRSVNCGEFGFYSVTADLLPPIGTTPVATSTPMTYEASFRDPVRATVWTITKVSCNSWKFDFTLLDADNRPVKGVPIHAFISLMGIDFNGQRRRLEADEVVTTGTTTQTAGKGSTTVTVFGTVLNQPDGFFFTKHGETPAGHFLDPFYSESHDLAVTGCTPDLQL